MYGPPIVIARVVSDEFIGRGAMGLQRGGTAVAIEISFPLPVGGAIFLELGFGIFRWSVLNSTPQQIAVFSVIGIVKFRRPSGAPFHVTDGGRGDGSIQQNTDTHEY